MVLGLSAKNKKGPSVHVNYLIRIQEIKPWPPSQSLRSLRSVMIQWENGDRISGSTNTVVPTIGSVVGEGKIEFNVSFRLPVTLLRDMSVKGRDADTFQKNFLEFNLYEPRRDRTQLLATATIDLADYGVVKEALSISAPMNCKRSFSNTAQPVIFIKIQPIDKGCTSSLSKQGLSKEVFLDKNGGESVSDLMNEEYAEEAEVATFTDDDVSSHSSLTISSAFESNGSLPPQNEESKGVTSINGARGNDKEHSLASNLRQGTSNTMAEIAPCENLKGSLSCSASVDLSSDLATPVNAYTPSSNSSETTSISITESVAIHSIHSSFSSFAIKDTEEETQTNIESNHHRDFDDQVHNKSNGRMPIEGKAQCKSDENTSNSLELVENIGSTESGDSQVSGEDDGKPWGVGKESLKEAVNHGDICDNLLLDIERKKQGEDEHERQPWDGEKHYNGDEPVTVFCQDSSENQVSFGNDTHASSGGNLEVKGTIPKNDRLKHVKSVRSSSDSVRGNGFISTNQHSEVKEVSTSQDAHNGAGSLRSNETKDAKICLKDTRSAISDRKIQQLECKIKMLEGELREAAAIEAALYSVVVEHASSMSKVHAPARRLSRLYFHACRENSRSRRAGAARSAVSGLVLVAKACGNDVPRLTFWLSNSVVLRAIISRVNEEPELPLSSCRNTQRNNSQKGNKKISSPLKWKDSLPSKKDSKSVMYGNFGNWEDPETFTSALEKVEAWIFCRIVESIWWQTLTPHMQSAATKGIDRGAGSDSRKNYGRTSSSVDQDLGDFSLDLWKKAFKDASERLCPLRAGGHQCGCLPVLARLIMEQCVARLDVAMFNAILRESADEIPTDPVSDPIGDSKVLPIPAGKSSFGAGAQLKNAIGNWSRWLTDLFGIDDDDGTLENMENHDDNDDGEDTSFKSFHLLCALSDLMMLPKDMLLSKSIRKEVCPTFGAPLIKRILDNFNPDEFCPDPVPDVVLEALESEDPDEAEESITNFPRIAAPTVYSPPSAASVASIIGELGTQSQLSRSRSSVLRKSYTSDDELDELNSPLAAILMDNSCASSSPTKASSLSKENSYQNVIRYELLRDIWTSCE